MVKKVDVFFIGGPWDGQVKQIPTELVEAGVISAYEKPGVPAVTGSMYEYHPVALTMVTTISFHKADVEQVQFGIGEGGGLRQVVDALLNHYIGREEGHGTDGDADEGSGGVAEGADCDAGSEREDGQHSGGEGDRDG